MPPNAFKIMIVDDEDLNLTMLSRLLTGKNYRVHAFNKGSLALEAAVGDPPDLFLLDINMPGMDGYELCTRLKAVAHLRHAPVNSIP